MGQAASAPRPQYPSRPKRRLSRLFDYGTLPRRSPTGTVRPFSASIERSVENEFASSSAEPYLNMSGEAGPARRPDELRQSPDEQREAQEDTDMRSRMRSLLNRGRRMASRDAECLEADIAEGINFSTARSRRSSAHQASLIRRFNSLRRARPPTPDMGQSSSRTGRRLRRTRPFSMQIFPERRDTNNSFRTSASLEPMHSINTRPPTPAELAPAWDIELPRQPLMMPVVSRPPNSLSTRSDPNLPLPERMSQNERPISSQIVPPLVSDRPSRSESLLDHVNRARPGDNQSSMLNRLLSAAAAMTAESLVASTEGRSAEPENTADTIDESFDGFLRALRSGRLAAALRQESSNMEGSSPQSFFRMFRFENLVPSARDPERDPDYGLRDPQGNRLVPIIIVGIRSVNPRDNSSMNDTTLPFAELLANLPLHPRAMPSDFFRSNQHASSRLPPSSRRASHSPTIGSDGVAARPPTPVDPPRPSDPVPPRSSEQTSNIRSPFSSENRHGRLPTYDARNSASGPDQRPRRSTDHRSWIIYVLGGSYPESHPILTTPSLFTDNPTYEDMVLLASLLGPAKPPVAAKSDVESAGGLYRVFGTNDDLILASDITQEVIRLPLEEHCLVCLEAFEISNEVRALKKCSHVFHRECIDTWLTTGRNSCPLCRSQGVEEVKAESSTAGTPV